MKILISGGHLTPALAFIDYAQTQHQDEFVFVGRTYSQMELRQKSQEENEVKKRGIPFIAFSSGKFAHVGPLSFFQEFFLFLRAMRQARSIFTSQRPDLFLSFGGYLAVPLTLVASWHHVPTVTHEQTRTAGLANKVIAFFAARIAVTYPETAQLFPKKKTVVTGNPLRSHIFQPNPPAPTWLNFLPKKPILYITGGSQGSRILNTLVSQTLSQLTADWCVIHQCGHPNMITDYRQELEKKKKTLEKNAQNAYHIREWITETELAWIYQHMKAIVSRSGANTVHEVTMSGKPALFIPLAHGTEQLKNAQAVVNTGAALLLLQKDADPTHFLKMLSQLRRQYIALQKNAAHNQQLWEKRADQKLYELVHTLSS